MQNLANKLMAFDNAVNSFHPELILGSLMGVHVQMDGKPVLDGGSSVKSDEGKRGIIFEESPEELALTRWRNGDFSEAEELLAERWKQSSKKQDLAIMKVWIKKWIGDIPKFENLQELIEFVDKLVETPNQSGLLAFMVSQLGFEPEGSQIFFKWSQAGSPKIKDFAPYAIHCFRVNIFCNIGMISGLLGTRTTNSIDMQYLYYLPFAMIFCSNDKFHSDIVSFFLTKNQYFIKGTDIKSDLRTISQLSKQPDGTNKDLDFTLLEDKNSFTYNVWKERIARLPERKKSGVSNSTKKKSANEFKDLMDQLKREENSNPTNEVFGVDQADFVIKKRTVRFSDFCLCGSGKVFGECCLKGISSKT